MFKRTEIENQIVQELAKLRLDREKEASFRSVWELIQILDEILTD